MNENVSIKNIQLHIDEFQSHETPNYVNDLVLNTINKAIHKHESTKKLISKIGGIGEKSKNTTISIENNPTITISSSPSFTINISDRKDDEIDYPNIRKKLNTYLLEKKPNEDWSTVLKSQTPFKTLLNTYTVLNETYISLVKNIIESNKHDISAFKIVLLELVKDLNKRTVISSIEISEDTDLLLDFLCKDMQIIDDYFYFLFKKTGNDLKEIIKEKHISKKITKKQLQEFIIQEIEDKFISNEKLPKAKLSYWESILAQLKNTDITLESILNYHPELFLFLDLLATPDLDVITPSLLKISTDVYVTFREKYPKNLSKEKIYLKLGEFIDKNGERLSKRHIKISEKGKQFSINKELKFTITKTTEFAKFTNWIVYKKTEGKKGKYEVIEKFIDQKELIKQFKEPGEYIVEAYGRSASYLSDKNNTAYKEVIIKEPSVAKVEVVGYKKSGFKIATNQQLTFKITKADIGEVENIRNIKWYLGTKEAGKKEYIEKEIEEAAGALELQHQFLENGDYQVKVTSGSVNNLVSKTINFNVKEPAVAKLEVEGQKGDKFRIRKDESLTFKITAADVGDIVNIPNVKWYLSYKKKGEANYAEEELIESAANLECKHKFKDEGSYIIKVTSGSEGNIVSKSIKFSVGKNYPLGIKINKNRVLHGIKQVINCEVTSYKIEPAKAEELLQTKWIVYKKGGQVYIPEGHEKIEEESYVYLAKGRKFEFVVDKEGDYIVEAYITSSDYKANNNTKSNSCKAIEVYHPQVISAEWTNSNKEKKDIVGLRGEIAFIKAQIDNFEEQKVAISFIVNGKAIVQKPMLVKTDSDGGIFHKIIFNDDLKKLLHLDKTDCSEVQFVIQGWLNNKIYNLKTPTYKSEDATIQVKIEKKIKDIYFLYNNKRVENKGNVPYGEKVTAVVETMNMIGDEVRVTIFRDRYGRDYSMKSEKIRVINNEGKIFMDYTIKYDLGDKLRFTSTNLLYIDVDSRYISSEKYEKTGIIVDFNEKPKEKKSDVIGVGGEELAWGSKVSVEFRKKVVNIAKDLWGEERKMEMANGMMTVMGAETGNTFYAHMLYGYKASTIPKSANALTKKNMIYYAENKDGKMVPYTRAVGLIQFTKVAMESLGLYPKSGPKGFDTLVKDKLALAKMGEIKQLDYVKKYLKNYAHKIKEPRDIYTAVFWPGALQKGDNQVIIKKSETDKDYTLNKSLDKDEDGIELGELLNGRFEPYLKRGKRLGIGINETKKLNQLLALKILKEKRITFSSNHSSGVKDKAMAIDNIKDIAAGGKSKLSNYDKVKEFRVRKKHSGKVEVSSELLYVIYMLSKKYTFNISEISGASHSSDSKHYYGKAIDISELNGQDIGQGVGKNAVCHIPDKLILEFEKEALKHGATKVLHKINRAKQKDHHNHFHVVVQ